MMTGLGQERETRRKILKFSGESGVVTRWSVKRVQGRVKGDRTGKHGFQRREYFYTWVKEGSVEEVGEGKGMVQNLLLDHVE